MRIILKRAWKIGFAIACISLLSLLLPFSRIIPSALIMMVNNIHEQRTALTHTEHIDVIFPKVNAKTGHHWYPFMLYYDAGRLLTRQSGMEIDLTILYNFGGFDSRTGNSMLYQVGTPYEGAFFGAYLLKEADEPYSYLFNESGLPLTASLGQIAKLDYVRLVLEGMGAERNRLQFEWVDGEVEADRISGLDFYEISSTLVTHSPVHSYQSFQIAYLQYGLPNKAVSVEFGPLTLYSRVWVGKIEPKGVSIVFYAMTPDEAFLNQIETDIIHSVMIKVDGLSD